MEPIKTIVNYLHAGAFLIICGGFSSLSHGEKGLPARIFGFRHLFYSIVSFLSFFLSASITLKSAFHYYNEVIFKVCNCPHHHFEKPHQLLFSQYSTTPFSLHLRQWEIENEESSLAQVRYAVKPKNPE